MATASAARVAPADGTEQWFLDKGPGNRMVLALSSGIDEEISWSLYRLAQLSHKHGQQFFLESHFGLTDALLEWPLWWLRENGGVPNPRNGNLLQGAGAITEVWALAPETQKKRKHALECLVILRNASVELPNGTFLVTNRRVLPLIAGMRSLPKTPLNAEFVVFLAEIFHNLGPCIILSQQPRNAVPIRAISELLSMTTDRSLIISLLGGLASLLNNPQNLSRVTLPPLVLDNALRYMPLTMDRPLLSASLNYVLAYLQHGPEVRNFLLHPRMIETVRCLVNLLVADRGNLMHSQPLGPPVMTAPHDNGIPLYQLTLDELAQFIKTPEPQRSMEWMKRLYVESPDADELQGSVWTLYRETFTPHAEQAQGGLAAAPELIKRLMEVFPKSNAMVDPGPPQRYIVRGITRRLQEGAFKCRWARGTCDAAPFKAVGELHVHLLSHLSHQSGCEWSTCSYGGGEIVDRQRLLKHVLTHLPNDPLPKKHPSQPDYVTLPHEPFPHPTAVPTSRPPPPRPTQHLQYPAPTQNPPSTSLTALLILRILFRASFPDSGPAPPVADENRFGFPTPPALTGEIQALAQEKAKEQEQADEDDIEDRLEEKAQARGRHAFERVASDLAKLRLGDESLAGWIQEMVTAVGANPFPSTDLIIIV